MSGSCGSKHTEFVKWLVTEAVINEQFKKLSIVGWAKEGQDKHEKPREEIHKILGKQL
jgi:hypothetical protein